MKTKRRKTEIYVEPVIPMEALAWPTEPDPKSVDIRKELDGKSFGALYVGWWVNTYWTEHGESRDGVGQGCSSGHSHSTWKTTKTNSQGCGVFYATKKDAILARRWALCRKFAKALHQMATMDTTEPDAPQP